MRDILDKGRHVITILLALGFGLYFVLIQSPFTARTIDAQAQSPADLEQIYNEWFSYVRIKHIDLEDTGFYTVNDDSTEIESYCFIGYIGNHGYLVELPAKDVYKITDDVTKGIKDATVVGEMLYDSAMLEAVAEDEGYTIPEYAAKYDVCRVSICKPTEPYLKNRPYVGILCLASVMISVCKRLVLKKINAKQCGENDSEKSEKA